MTFEAKQIVVAAYDNISLGRDRRRQNHIVVGVAADGCGQSRRLHYQGAPTVFLQQGDVGAPDAKLPAQGDGKFLQEGFAGAKLLVAYALAHQIAAEPVGHEGGHKHVGVEHQSHDTARKTSSSV